MALPQRALDHPPGIRPDPPAEVERATLRLAAERIRGTGRYAPRDKLLFGLAAMDRWIATMRSDRGFCAQCFAGSPVPGVQDARDNDRRMRAAAQVLERQLRSGFTTLPADARLPLEQAADCYQRIAKTLGEALDTKGFYDRLDSLEAQSAYAQRQLAGVRAELVAAADRFDEALRIAEGRLQALRAMPADGQQPESRATPDAGGTGGNRPDPAPPSRTSW